MAAIAQSTTAAAAGAAQSATPARRLALPPPRVLQQRRRLAPRRPRTPSVATLATAAPLSPTPDSLFRVPEGAPAEDHATGSNSGAWSLPSELPRPAAYQQTLARSFTLGGIGLHTGRFHTVRLRPAHAGEGRYFVRVPAGTNAERWDPERAADGEALAGAMLLDVENPPMDAGAGDAAAAREEVRRRAAMLRAVAGGADDPETERKRAELFREWRDAVDNGGADEDGGFEAWVRAREREEAEAAKALVAGTGGSEVAAATAHHADHPNEDSEVVPRPVSGAGAAAVVEASIRAVYVVSAAPCVQLHASDPRQQSSRVVSVLSPERLLAALEACGVDNCRIEIEPAAEDEEEGEGGGGGGGDNDTTTSSPLTGALEVPVMDGSALGWCLWLQSAGLKPAPIPAEVLARADKAGGESLPRLADGTPVAPRGVLAPREPVTVRAPFGQDAHATLVPALFPRYTAGLDRTAAAPVIGAQWHSWSYARGEHFRYALAPARMFASSRDEMQEMRRRGLMRGGGEGVMLVAHGRRWWDSSQLRFPLDEPSRSECVDLVGTLALLGVAGHGGLPAGHAVAFNADPALRLELARQVLASCVRAVEEDQGGKGPASWEDLLVSFGSVLAAQRGEVEADVGAARERSVAAGLRDAKQLQV